MKRGLCLLAAVWAGFPAVAGAPPKAPVPGDPGCLPRVSDGYAEPSIAEKQNAGTKAVRTIFGTTTAAQALAKPSRGAVAQELGGIAMDQIMGGLWSRCGLRARERSLVNLGILIAARANDQLAEHFRVGMHNGLTQRELEEVIYQAAGYAGFPAAANAREVLTMVLNSEISNNRK